MKRSTKVVITLFSVAVTLTLSLKLVWNSPLIQGETVNVKNNTVNIAKNINNFNVKFPESENLSFSIEKLGGGYSFPIDFFRYSDSSYSGVYSLSTWYQIKIKNLSAETLTIKNIAYSNNLGKYSVRPSTMFYSANIFHNTPYFNDITYDHLININAHGEITLFLALPIILPENIGHKLLKKLYDGGRYRESIDLLVFGKNPGFIPSKVIETCTADNNLGECRDSSKVKLVSGKPFANLDIKATLYASREIYFESTINGYKLTDKFDGFKTMCIDDLIDILDIADYNVAQNKAIDANDRGELLNIHDGKLVIITARGNHFEKALPISARLLNYNDVP